MPFRARASVESFRLAGDLHTAADEIAELEFIMADVTNSFYAAGHDFRI